MVNYIMSEALRPVPILQHERGIAVLTSAETTVGESTLDKSLCFSLGVMK
jgi:hypothetical protein